MKVLAITLSRQWLLSCPADLQLLTSFVFYFARGLPALLPYCDLVCVHARMCVCVCARA